MEGFDYEDILWDVSKKMASNSFVKISHINEQLAIDINKYLVKMFSSMFNERNPQTIIDEPYVRAGWGDGDFFEDYSYNIFRYFEDMLDESVKKLINKDYDTTMEKVYFIFEQLNNALEQILEKWKKYKESLPIQRIE